MPLDSKLISRDRLVVKSLLTYAGDKFLHLFPNKINRDDSIKMARMYSRKRGKATSKKPLKKAVPSWARYKPKEVEMLILKFAKEGSSPSKIGIILRDTYGIPDVRVLCKKRISLIIGEKGVKQELPEDLSALIKKAVLVRKHLEENKKDQGAHRGLTLTESKIKRLVKYYKKTGKLASEWKYEPDKAGFFVE